MTDLEQRENELSVLISSSIPYLIAFRDAGGDVNLLLDRLKKFQYQEKIKANKAKIASSLKKDDELLKKHGDSSLFG